MVASKTALGHEFVRELRDRRDRNGAPAFEFITGFYDSEHLPSSYPDTHRLSTSIVLDLSEIIEYREIRSSFLHFYAKLCQATHVLFASD